MEPEHTLRLDNLRAPFPLPSKGEIDFTSPQTHQSLPNSSLQLLSVISDGCSPALKLAGAQEALLYDKEFPFTSLKMQISFPPSI